MAGGRGPLLDRGVSAVGVAIRLGLSHAARRWRARVARSAGLRATGYGLRPGGSSWRTHTVGLILGKRHSGRLQRCTPVLSFLTVARGPSPVASRGARSVRVLLAD